MKYDDYTWHLEGDYPEGLGEENSVNHIAIFLYWCLQNDLVSDWLVEECEEELDQLKEGEISAVEFILDCCDGKLTSEDLNVVGNAFASHYFENEYVNDLVKLLPERKNDYDYEVTSELLDSVSRVLDLRFEEFEEKKIPGN